MKYRIIVLSLLLMFLCFPVFANSENRQVTIIIDAAHGGIDSGAVYEDLEEKNVSLNIALQIEDMLKNAGFLPVMIRRNDIFVNSIQREKIIADTVNPLVIEIHTGLYKEPTGKPMMEISVNSNSNFVDAALKVYADLQTDFSYSRFVSRDDFMKPHVVSISIGNMTSPENRTLLKDNNFQHSIATAVAESLIKNFDF